MESAPAAMSRHDACGGFGPSIRTDIETLPGDLRNAKLLWTKRRRSGAFHRSYGTVILRDRSTGGDTAEGRTFQT